MTAPPATRLSRRGLLGLAGAAALAGCGGLADRFADEEPTVIEGAELAGIGTPAPPDVPRALPTVASAHLSRARRRVRDRLSTVPSPLGPEHVPNGAIRERIADARESARSNLERASAAPSRYEALRFLRFARGNAANAAAGWRAARGSLDRSDVRSAADGAADDLASLRGRIEYVGDRAVPTVVVLDAVESLASGAEEDLRQLEERFPSGPVGAPVVGRMAHLVESARAATDDAAHVYDRHRGSAEGLRPMEGAFDAASAELSSAVHERLEGLPAERPEPSALARGDVSGTPAEWLLRVGSYAVYGPGGRIRELRGSGQHASAVMVAHRALTSLRAFDRVRERVDSGERFGVESVSDVRAMRRGAVEALESALTTAAPVELTRTRASDVAGFIGAVDEALVDGPDRWSAAEVGEEAVEYVWAGAVAAAIARANERVVEALNAGQG